MKPGLKTQATSRFCSPSLPTHNQNCNREDLRGRKAYYLRITIHSWREEIKKMQDAETGDENCREGQQLPLYYL